MFMQGWAECAGFLRGEGLQSRAPVVITIKHGTALEALARRKLRIDI